MNIFFPILYPFSCFTKSANAYQKCRLVVDNLGGSLVFPRGKESWVPAEFRRRAMPIDVPLFPGEGLKGGIGTILTTLVIALRCKKQSDGFVFAVSNEFSLFGVLLAGLSFRINFALFCWDPPGVTVHNRRDGLSRVRAWLLNHLFSMAAACSRCVILNLDPGFLEGRISRRNRSKFLTFPNGTNVLQNRQAVTGVSHIPRRIAVNSSITYDKGADLVIEFFIKMWKTDHRVSLVWTGGGDVEMARRRFLDAGIPESNWQLLQCTHEDAMRNLATASVGFNAYRDVPSLRWNYVLKIPEFLSVGVPVVTMNLPGACAYAGEAVFPVTDLSDAEEKIFKLFDDGEMMERAARACEKSEEMYDWQKINEEIGKRLVQCFETINDGSVK